MTWRGRRSRGGWPRRQRASTGSSTASSARTASTGGNALHALPRGGRDGESSPTWFGTATDIEDRHRLEQLLREAERQAVDALTLLEHIQAATPVAFKLLDTELRVVRMNDRMRRFSARSAEDQLGRQWSELCPHLWRRTEFFYERALHGGATYNVEVVTPDTDDPSRNRYWLASYYPVRGDDGAIIGVGNVVVDITERKTAEEFRSVVMEHMAEGLYALDRQGLVTYANPAAARLLGWTQEELLGKPMHDLVHFQHVDGSAADAAKCRLLKVRSHGRTLRDVDDAFTRKDGTVVPVSYSSAPLLNGPKVDGVVVVFRDITKERRQQAAVQQQLVDLTWIGRIRDAIDEHRLVLFTQPILPLAGGRLSEEVLLRMLTRDGEVVPPDRFLPVAEKYGLIGEIDRWVIAQSLRLSAQSGRVLHINVSAASLASDDLLPFIERQLAESKADPHNVLFEITETAVMEDLAAGTAFSRRVTALGCGLALDDFGIGFGSFTHLKELSLSHLKIDKQFVKDLATNAANRHVVETVVRLAQAFGLRTVAEGVEDAETLADLREAGVDHAQGFYLGEPRFAVDHR